MSERLSPQSESAIQRLISSAGVWLYILPALAVYSLFFLRPLVELVQISLYKWDGIGPQQWVGLANYRTLLTGDPLFWQAARHNLAWMGAAIVVPTALGLGAAIVLVRGRIHARALYRMLLFLPQVLSSVVVAVVWGWFYNPATGALDSLMHAAHLGRPDWLGDPNLVLPALFAVWAWVTYGFAMVVFVAALQSIDEDYFDAAKMDGAGLGQQLRHVILPGISQPLTVVLLINAITAFQVFDLVFIMTNGGPYNTSNVLELYMYNSAFQYSQVGYGAAIATLLGVVILSLSLVFLRFRRVIGAPA